VGTVGDGNDCCGDGDERYGYGDNVENSSGDGMGITGVGTVGDGNDCCGDGAGMGMKDTGMGQG